MNSELQRFVRDALGRGLSRDAIRDQLDKAGWRSDEIQAALGLYAEVDFPVPVPRRRPYLNAREAFLYLILFATLYTSAINTGQVLFALIDRWLPESVRATYEWDRFLERVRSASAGLVIAFPIYLILSRVIGRELTREPEKRGSPIRKWLTYITLFVAALVMIGALTVLVQRMLAGDLPPRFLLKVFVVLGIAATVFGHYLGDLRREEQEAGAPMAPTGLGARLAAVAVFIVLLSGLIYSGSPRQARLHRLDLDRVEALGRITAEVQGYHAQRHRLPDSLETLLRLPNTFAAETIRDPVTGRPYEYRILDSLSYELCADFQTADTLGQRARFSEASEFWKHGVGRKCFRFEVIAKRP